MLGFRFRKFDAGAPPQRRPVWAVFALLALSVSALSADSPSGVSAADGNGGFLYSRYLHNAQNAAGAADGGRIGSFRVQIHRSAFISAAGRERLRAAAGRELQGLSPSSFAPGYLADGRGDLAADFSAATEAGFGRLADAAARELFFAATDDARTVGSLRRVQVEVQTPLGGRRGNIAFDFIGELSETEFDAAAWQLRAFATEDESEGANFGLLYRRATERLLYGVNSFVDYETADEGGFFRWSAGGELRSPWLDFFGNYYRAITDPYAGVDANDLPTATYTADGYDLEINLHSPRYPWISAVLGWYFYEGYEDRELALFRDDEEGVRAGLKLTPRNFPLEAEFEYERAGGDGGDEFGGRLVLHHIIGRTRSAGYAEGEFRPQDWFFAPAEREHTQRIYTVGISTAVINSFLFLRSLAPAGGELSVSGQPPANATTAINLVATGAANGGFTVDGNVGGAAVAATVAAADPEGYGLPDATVLTVETGAPVNSTLVSAFFVYQDGRTSVTVGSTVAFYPPADNGGRRIDLLDGQIVVETDAPVTALVMSAAAAVATVAISPGDAVTVGFAAGTVSVFSEDGNFSVNGGTGGCANVGVSDGGDVSLAVECSLTYTLAENSAFAADAGITLNVSGGNVEIVRVEPAALPDLHFAELTPSGGVGTDYSVVKASTNVSVDLSDGAHTGSQLSLASSFTSGTTTLTLDVVSTSAIDGVPDRTVTAEIIVAVRATTETLSDLTLNENSGYETGNVSLTIGGGNITISYLETETLPAVHFADLSAGGGVGTYVFSIADDPDSAISLGTDDTQLFLDLADPDPFISGTTTVTLAVESGTGALAQTVSAAFTLRVIREELPELVAEFRDSDGDTVGGDEVLTLTVDNNDLEDTQIATVFIDGGEPPYMITDGGGNLSLSLNAATDEGAAYITMFALSDISSRPDLWTITAQIEDSAADPLTPDVFLSLTVSVAQYQTGAALGLNANTDLGDPETNSPLFLPRWTGGEDAEALVLATAVGRGANDDGGDAYVYNLQSGGDGAAFAIDADNGEITFASDTAPTDIGLYTIMITATNDDDSSFREGIAWTLEVLPEAVLDNLMVCLRIGDPAECATSTPTEDMDTGDLTGGPPTLFSVTLDVNQVEGTSLTVLLTFTVGGGAVKSGYSLAPDAVTPNTDAGSFVNDDVSFESDAPAANSPFGEHRVVLDSAGHFIADVFTVGLQADFRGLSFTLTSFTRGNTGPGDIGTARQRYVELEVEEGATAPLDAIIFLGLNDENPINLDATPAVALPTPGVSEQANFLGIRVDGGTPPFTGVVDAAARPFMDFHLNLGDPPSFIRGQLANIEWDLAAYDATGLARAALVVVTVEVTDSSTPPLGTTFIFTIATPPPSPLSFGDFGNFFGGPVFGGQFTGPGQNFGPGSGCEVNPGGQLQRYIAQGPLLNGVTPYNIRAVFMDDRNTAVPWFRFHDSYDGSACHLGEYPAIAGSNPTRYGPINTEGQQLTFNFHPNELPTPLVTGDMTVVIIAEDSATPTPDTATLTITIGIRDPR